MRFFVIVVGALLSLGLAAFGFVSAQKGAAPKPAARRGGTRRARTPARSRRRRRRSQPPRRKLRPRQRAWPRTHPRPMLRLRPRTAPQAPALRLRTGPPPPPATYPACDKPGGMGLARIVEIDTTGGPGFGFEHFKQYDFLRDKEVVLTFDDGPWPENTPAVLKALTDNCLKATFFEIGKHATWHPEITKQVIEAGMTVGTPHLVAQGSGAEPLRQGSRSGQAGNRDGRQRRAYGRRRADRAVFPLPRPATPAGDAHLSRRAQHRDLLDRHRFLRLSGCTSRSR